VGDNERHADILLDNKHGGFLFLVETLDNFVNLFYQHGSQTQRRLVGISAGGCHHRPADNQHLLFAAGKLTGSIFTQVFLAGEIFIYHFYIAVDFGFVAAVESPTIKFSSAVR
jgi:hypothetical protein